MRRSNSSNKPSICVVAHSAYGMLSGKSDGKVGGAERHASLIARWLAAHGWRVSMVTWDEYQPDGESVDGVQILKMCRRDQGIRGLRFFYPRWTSLVRAMSSAQAELYFYNLGDLGLGQVVLWSRLNRAKSVYLVESEPDCDPAMPQLTKLRERLLYRIGLSRVDQIITQTKRQRQMLWSGFGLRSVIIPMPCDGPSEQQYIPPTFPGTRCVRILWVGRFSREKRLEWLLDVAERCPDWIFDVVGAAEVDSEYTAQLMQRARRIPNVILHGKVQHREIGSFYRQAAALCCTSLFEGFPNTFLEAWSNGIPTVSTFDPDDLIATHRLGGVARDVSGLVAELHKLISSRECWERVSANARRYYWENHRTDVVMPQFERVFLQVLGRT